MGFPWWLMVSNPSAMQELQVMWVQTQGRGDPLDGSPLQYSCLEDPTDRGAWQTTVNGDAMSQTWRSNFACMQGHLILDSGLCNLFMSSLGKDKERACIDGVFYFIFLFLFFRWGILNHAKLFRKREGLEWFYTGEYDTLSYLTPSWRFVISPIIIHLCLKSKVRLNM